LKTQIKNKSLIPSAYVLLTLTLTSVFLGLSGCAAVHTSIAKKDLDVQTKMSETVFLDPVSPDKKVIFISIRNTSDKNNFDINSPIQSAISRKGYQITANPDEAHYILQANVLSVAKSSPTAAEAALHSGYGGVVAGAALGVGIGGAAGGLAGAGYGGLAGGLIGAAAETIGNAYVKDVTFVVITDIEISEKAKDGVVVRQDTKLGLKQGLSGSASQTSSEVVDRKKYRTRIVSTANKANLEYEQAAGPLTDGMVRSISGLF
jgi:hypothetical protein